jgi:transposase
MSQMCARPAKLTSEVQARLVEALNVGGNHAQAAHYAGIDPDTLRRWLRTGEAATTGPFYALCVAIKKAESNAPLHWLAIIEQAAKKGEWTAAAWKLERKYPDEWGRRQRVDLKHSGNINHEMSHMIQQVVAVAWEVIPDPEQRALFAQRLLALDAAETGENEPRTIGPASANDQHNGYHH